MSCTSSLLTNRCQLPCRSLWFGRAHLFEDGVRIVGWQFWGRYDRHVPLERIQEVEWRTVVDDINLILHLEDGGVVPLQLLKNAGTWNMKLHDLLGQSVLSHHSALPAGQTEQEVEERPVS